MFIVYFYLISIQKHNINFNGCDPISAWCTIYQLWRVREILIFIKDLFVLISDLTFALLPQDLCGIRYVFVMRSLNFPPATDVSSCSHNIADDSGLNRKLKLTDSEREFHCLI